jgi:hypothetical protein
MVNKEDACRPYVFDIASMQIPNANPMAIRKMTFSSTGSKKIKRG